MASFDEGSDRRLVAALLAAGADLDAHSSPASGGAPAATALRHARVFGMTAVIDVLVAAGAND